ncbi:hypothetical protein GCM10009555_008190 [Acrocarpospora macrocephala]|uniref:Uncharacterized protein n=2 Tax=Acrocarpospora macrocephala TaxID=150177 RepID=A0A5M3WUG2_9ACTN|nr:hypothetical protein Amac_066220 [Acrocarpospora macrocephala]
MAMAEAVANFPEALREASQGLKYLSPFHYYIGGEPLKNGMQWADASILIAISAVLVAVGLARFNRRDITS